MALICALFVGCWLVLTWRLYTFQVLDTTHYLQLADAERHAEITTRRFGSITKVGTTRCCISRTA